MKISEYKLSSDSIYLVQWKPDWICYIVKQIEIPCYPKQIDENLIIESIQELRNSKGAVIYTGKIAMDLIIKRYEELSNTHFVKDNNLLCFMDIPIRDISEFPRNNFSILAEQSVGQLHSIFPDFARFE